MTGKASTREPVRDGADRKEADALGVAATVTGIAVNVATLLGSLQTFSSGDGLWALSGIGSAAFFLYAAWRRHGTAMAASLVVLAVVALAGLVAHYRAPVQPEAAGKPAASALAVPATGAATRSASAPPQREIEITLPRHASVNLDPAGQPTVVGGQYGLTGEFDLYHDAGEVRSDTIVASDGMYVYPVGASPDRAFAICTDATSPASTEGGYEDRTGLEAGDAFCFRTTQGKLAWAVIEAVQPDSDTAILKVRIWDKPGNGSS